MTVWHESSRFFVAREPAVDRLAQEIGQGELRVQALSRVAQVFRDERLQPQAFIQLAYQDETGIGGDARPLERDLQKTIKCELKGLGL